jgi:hypothetical protein
LVEATRLNLPETWIPHQPHEQQHLALIAPRFMPDAPVEVFYGGAAGGGKSDWLLMAALQYVDVPGYNALVLRRTMTALSLPGALLPRAQEWLSGTAASWSSSRGEWSFPAGSTLTFSYLEHEDDVYRYQSTDFQFIGFDELTHFSQGQYTYMFSRLRRPSQGPLSKVPLRQCSASNPGGPGHTWVKNRFVKPKRLPADRVFVPAKLDDNPSLDRANYRRSLQHLGDVLAAQLLDGDWGAFEGAAYAGFRTDLHVIDPWPIPSEWERYECMDYGTAAPTSWAVVSVDHDGNQVVSDLYYSPGLVSKHAAEVLDRRAQGWQRRRQDGWTDTNVVWGDPTIRNRTGHTDRVSGRALSVEADFAEHGIAIAPANNDRMAGYMRIAELLRADPERPFPHWHPRYGEQGSPRLFVMEHCAQLVEQLEVAPIEDEGPLTGRAVQAKWERDDGHAHAMLRYGVMSRPAPTKTPVALPETERELREAQARRALDRARRPSHVLIG